jgi:hypothetical protein
LEQKQQTVAKLQKAQDNKNATEFRRRLIKTLLPLFAARGAIDFLVPIVVAVLAFVMLVIEIR